MSDGCTTSATATLYSTEFSIVVQTAYVNNNINGSQVESSYLQIATSSQVFPTATLYGTDCGTTAIAVASSTAVAASAATSSRNRATVESVGTTVVPTSTATFVSASRNNGGSVVYVTSFSTMSATSAFIVYETKSNSLAVPTSTTLQSNAGSSSSHAGPIAGGIIAAVVVLALLALLALCIRKRSRRDRDTRALDDFFKDALNPGEAALAGGALDGTASSRRSMMRRKSSTILDLEKAKVSNSNDEDNWAALTRISLSIGGHEDHFVDSQSRANSRLSLNGISRGASIRSYGPEDGLRETNAASLVEEPDSVQFPATNLLRSRSSLVRSPYEDGRPRSAHRIQTHHTSDPPTWSPGLTMQSTSTGDASPHSEEGHGMFPLPVSAFHHHIKGGRPNPRIHHHLSMSGMYPLAQQAISESNTPSDPETPERPKSALGIMAVPEPHSPRLRHPSLQQPYHHRSSLQNRRSIAGYQGQYSPPMRPIRSMSGQTHFASNYPPSRYSHLDIVNPEHVEMSQGVSLGDNVNRQRSLSGSILVKMAASLSDDAAIIDSDPSSSATTSLKAPRLTRSNSPEVITRDNSDDDLMIPQSATTTTTTPPPTGTIKDKSVLNRTKSLLNGSQRESFVEDGAKKTNFWQPQAWRARVN